MDRAGKLLELEALAENLLKSQKKSALLKLKVLYFASEYENLSVSIIIQKLGMQKSNFALAMAEMEKEGLIEICQAEIDRRCRTVRLTNKGREMLENYKQEIETCLGATTPQFDACLNTITDTLNKII